MQDIQLIYIFLLVLYLSESLYWIPKNSVIFSFTKKGKGKLKLPGDLLGTQNKSLVISNLFFPYKLFSIVQIPSISLSEKYIVNFTTATLKNTMIDTSCIKFAFDDIETIETDDSDLYINNNLFTSFYNSETAPEWGKTIRRFKDLPQSQRKHEIEESIDRNYDDSILLETIDCFFKLSIPLRILNTLLLIVVIASTITAFVYSELTSLFFYSIIFIYILSFMSGFHFYYVHKLMYPDLKRRRILSTLKIMFYPPAAVGSVSELSLHLLSGYHFLPLMYHICRKEVFEKVAGVYVRHLMYPIEQGCLDNDPAAQEIEQYWRNSQIERTKRFLEEKGFDIQKLLIPTKEQSDGLYYCPRCLTFFNSTLENCSDCFGVKLEKVER